MRMVFGVLSLLFVVAIVGVLAKKQLSSVPAPVSSDTSATGTPGLSGSPKQQVQQFKGAVEGAVQQARPMPDDTK